MMKIKPKLTLAFLLAGLVPLVILGIFSYNNAKEGVTNGVLNQLQSVAVIQKHRVESVISQNLERLALVSSRTQLRISLGSYNRENSAADQERMNTILLDARSSIKGFEEIYVLNLDGEVVAATNGTVIGSSFANEEAFIRGRAEENSGALLFLDETEELENYLSGPLYLEDEFIGVVIIKSSADNILAVLGDYAGLGSTGETLLAERNQEGNALFISPLRFDPQAELHRTMSIDNLDSPTVQALLGNEGLLTDAVDYRGEPVLAAAQYIPEVDWGLVTKIDQAEASAPVALLHNLTVLTIGLAAALVVGVSLYLARSVSKPIQSLAHVIDKIREGDISQRAEVTSNDEVGMLAQHFNEMTEDLVRTNNNLRSTNRALKTLSECNQILVRSTDESTLLKGICRIIVTYGGYCGARVGLVDPDDEVAVRPVAEAWRQDGDCSNYNVAWPGDEGDHAVFMEAVKSDKPLVLKDIHIDASCAHLCAEANERGYVSLIALPLSANGQASGALMIYSAEASPFEEDELRLLTELADDLAYGIRAQRIRNERERTEAALRDSEASLTEAQRIAHIGSWELDLVTNKITWSDEVYRIFGLEPQQFEATYEAFLDKIHPDDREMVDKAYTESVSNKKPYDIVHRLLLKDGNVRYVYERCKTFYDNGKPVRSIGTVQDITEREQALAKLKESENRYSTLVERGNDGIITIQDGLLKFVNSKMVEMTGFSRDEALGKAFTDFVAPEYREAVIDRYKKRMSGKVTPSNYEIEILAKDARRIPVEISASQIEYGGKPADMAIIRDITERKLAEEAVKAERQRFNDVLDTLPAYLVLLTPDYHVSFANRFFRERFGESHGKRCFEYLFGRTEPCEVCETYKVLETMKPLEWEWIGLDGHNYYIYDFPFTDTDGSTLILEVGLDVTERKRAEDALRQSEERYRDLFDNAHDLIQSVSPEGHLLYVNQAWQDALGYSEKEIANLKVWDIIHPDSMNHCMEAFQKVMSGEDVGDIESTFVAKDGSLVAVEGNAHCRSVDGRPISTQGIFRDVTARKMAEEALRESEERYRALVDLGSEVGEAVVMLQDNKHGNAVHVFFNREWPRITGYSREELLKMSFFDLVRPEERKASQERHQRKMKGEAVPGLFEIQIIRKDGTQVPVEVTSAYTKYLGGTANVAYIRDITERKQAEAKHQAIIKTAVDGFWIADLAGRFLEVNDSYCEMVGYTQEELSKMSISDIEAIDTPKDITRRMKRIMKQGYERFETRHKHKDGRIIDVDISANYSDVGKGQMFVFIRDITERKRAEEALRESEERYRSLVNNVKLGILRSTPGPPGKILAVNPALEEITGYSRDELLAMDMEELYVHCEERQALMAELTLAKGTVSRELHWRKKDGSEIVALDTVMTVTDGGGKVLYFDSIFEDITERKQAEESLKASEAKLRLMFKSVPEGITVSDLEGNIRDTNEAAVHMHGYDSKEEMIGKGALELIAKEDHASAMDNLKETLEEGLSPTVEYTFLKKDGSKFPAELSAALLKDGAGNPVGFIAVTRDITERKQAEEALRESEERYKSLVNNVKLGIFRSIMTEKGRALEVNPALEEITGYSRKELLKMEFAKLYTYPEERRAFLDELAATKKPVNRELHWKRRDGREIVILARTAPVTNNAGKIVCLDSIVEDITERKQAEQLYYTLANSSPVGVYIEQDRKLIFTNPAFQRATDFTADELLGKDPSTIVYPEDRESVRQNAVQMLKGHRLQPYEFRYVTRSGEIKWGIERVVSVTYQGKQAALGDVMDITERKKMEEQLILTDRLASVGELASGIAHELNNPLTGVIGLSQILTQRDVPEDIKEDLNLVYSEAQRAATIVKNLLTFARKHSPAKDLLNINDVIGRVLELRAYEQRVSNIEVVTHLAPNLPQIMADYFQLQQVFLNIVINAEHFMIEAHNKGTLTITTERAGDYVRASFTDDGPGIPKENLGHIFDPFFTTKEVGKGTGLGLSICHGIISAHNGQIYAESEPDKGATFVIELPLSQEEQQDEEL